MQHTDYDHTHPRYSVLITHYPTLGYAYIIVDRHTGDTKAKSAGYFGRESTAHLIAAARLSDLDDCPF